MPQQPPQQIAGVGDAVGPDQWLKSLPLVTQYWFGATMVITIAANVEILDAKYLIYYWDMIKTKMELWRFITCFCYAGPFSFNTLITCYMLVNMSQQYEKGGPFNTGAGGGTADYIFAIMFGCVMIVLTYPLAYMLLGVALPPVFTKNLVFYTMYLWSKRNPTQQANIWGVPMPAVMLPFAYVALSLFMGNYIYDLIQGLAVGHLYYFLADVCPQVYGRDVLVTPQFLIDQFGIGEYRPVAAVAPAAARHPAQPARPGQQPAPAPAAAGRGGGYNWGGGGQPLGRN